MNNNTNKIDGEIPNEVLELVPWFAIGKLSIKDQAFFDDALIKYSALSELVQQEKQMLKAVSADQSLLDKSSIAATEERLKAVFNMIDVEEKQNQIKQKNSENPILTKLKSVFDFLIPSSVGTPKYARVVSVAVLFISVAALTAFIAPLFTQSSDFTPASASSQNQSKKTLKTASAPTVLLVGFKGTSVELGNNDVLKGKLSSIKSVPDKEGIYQIIFKQPLSADEVKQTIDSLLAQKQLIWFAGEEF